jgi:hypothetical protein
MAENQRPAAVPRLVHESDWLASTPLFYNESTGAWSQTINDVIDYANLEFDPEGLNDYLDFGFSVFERTPVRGVRMLRYSSRLYSGPDGLRVEHLDDPAYEWLDRRSTVEEVLELAAEKINGAVAPDDADVVVPTSGGCDSRLINLLIRDRSRIRAFTYGVADDQARSTEAVKAARLARRLGLDWQLVRLGDFHRFIGDWEALYGVSTHAHGMYHLEFYRRILALVEPGSPLLSGACGEWFSGDDPEVRVIDTLTTPDDVLTVFRYGDMNADSRMSYVTSERRGAWELLESTPRIRAEMLPRVFTVVRLRMALLSYLLRVPASLGLRPRAPFLDIDLAMRLLTLPAHLRHERAWEHDYFRLRGADLESSSPASDGRNTLNYQGMRRVPLQPLDVAALREVVRPEYVRWINRHVGLAGLPYEVMYQLEYTRGFRRATEALRRLGVADRRLQAYGAYLTLKPLETLLRRRDLARRDGGRT